MLVLPFPALDAKEAALETGKEKIGAEASCFYHDDKTAEAICDDCGRYICGLCVVNLAGGKVSCPECVYQKSKGELKQGSDLERERLLPGSVAMSLAILPMLIFYFTLFTAPITMIYLYRKRKEPEGYLTKYRWRRWVAGLIATAQLVGWVVGIIFLMSVFQESSQYEFDSHTETFIETEEVIEEEF